jgi:hypothetical protein
MPAATPRPGANAVARQGAWTVVDAGWHVEQEELGNLLASARAARLLPRPERGHGKPRLR